MQDEAATDPLIQSTCKSLRRLRAIGVPCAHSALHTDQQLFEQFEECTAVVIGYDDDTGESAYDEEGDEYSVVPTDGSDWWREATVRIGRLAAAAPSRPICLRGSAANGRIGLLLRRLPALSVTLRTGATESAVVCSARLWGQELSPVPDTEDWDASSTTEQHLGCASGNEVLRPTAHSSARDWVPALAYALAKVYCCRRETVAGVYAAAVDDQDEWTKVRWRETSDGAAILRVALDAAAGLARGDACTVRIGLELIFGDARRGGSNDAVGSMALATAAVSAEARPEDAGDLRAVQVVAAAVVERGAAAESAGVRLDEVDD